MMMLNSYVTVALLCIINLLNYMDRFTIAAVLRDIKTYFGINNATSGLLQTAFVCSIMISAPVFGFLGDRYSRKIIIICGVLFWSSITLGSSFVQPNSTGIFFVSRALVGIGQASYTTVAPTIIADLFVGKRRSRMFALYYFAIPVGSGLGYIVGSQMAKHFDGWQWALRFTPPIGIISAICFAFVQEPKRGTVEAHNIATLSSKSSSSLNFREVIEKIKIDIHYLVTVPSYIWVTCGFTAVGFSVGAFAWWAPYFMERALVDSAPEKVSLIFGAIACLGGFLGVVIGSASSQILRPKYLKIDPLICGIGVFLSIPCGIIGVTFARTHPTIAWTGIFLSITFLSANWSVVADIVMYVIVPSRRATAQAVQISISLFFGEASSPFIIGGISSLISTSNPTDPDVAFKSLQTALYLTPVVLLLSGCFFIYSARHLIKDENSCKHAITGSESALSGKLVSNSVQQEQQPLADISHL